MDVKALGVGQRGAQSVIIPNGEDHLDCEECGMCIDICPVGALTSGTYRYQTRPWEMKYVSTVCAHCSNGCKTTLSVRNHEILRANNRDLSGFNKDFLCVKGRFGFDFTRHPERLKQPLVRRNGKLEPASWEDALEEVAARLAEMHKQSGADAIGFFGSNRTTNEENYLLGRIARASIGTNNIDHHRTADYASLMALAASGETLRAHRGAAMFATMSELASAPAFLLVGNDATEQNPLVAWQIRSAIRHRGARLYVINSRRSSCAARRSDFVELPPGRKPPRSQRWLAGGEAHSIRARPAAARLRATRLASENDLVIVFGAAFNGAGSCATWRNSATRRRGKRTRFMALGDYANSRGAADMGLLPDLLARLCAGRGRRGARSFRQALGREAAGEAGAGRARDAGCRG